MKPIWQSKTLWINLISAVLSGVEAVNLTDTIPDEHQMKFMVGLAVLNMALRFLTKQQVTVRA
ncbi:hypothetical protein [Roseovarius sp. MMSF_3350]|uniref:hypothetical protein n=1 Tax=Roseovarius sp. MMSF_3350 TaxID=3046706 RepID=UPI00273F2070|nr:hypothetical protein [Roseovarius sp. MMSF_3350]